MSDLTERLAAKLRCAYFGTEVSGDLARNAEAFLMILLSEPELVAGLAPEVKREVLRTLLGERLNEMIEDHGEV